MLTGANTYSGGPPSWPHACRSVWRSVAGALTVFSGGRPLRRSNRANRGTVKRSRDIASGRKPAGGVRQDDVVFHERPDPGHDGERCHPSQAPSTTAGAFAVAAIWPWPHPRPRRGGGLRHGTYRLFDYTGSLTGSLALGTTPAHTWL